MNETEVKNLSRINAGQKATVVLNYIGPILKDQKESIVSKMKSMYRSGEATETVLLASVGELVALDTLESKINITIKQSERAVKEIRNDG